MTIQHVVENIEMNGQGFLLYERKCAIKHKIKGRSASWPTGGTHVSFKDLNYMKHYNRRFSDGNSAIYVEDATRTK